MTSLPWSIRRQQAVPPRPDLYREALSVPENCRHEVLRDLGLRSQALFAHDRTTRIGDLRDRAQSAHENRCYKAPRKWSNSAGFTLIELAISVFLTLFVVIVMGRVVIQNQRSFGWGRDKVTLQQNVTEACEWMARTVRAARTLDVVSASELRAYDENGALVHTFRRFTVDGTPRLQQDGADLVDRKCTQFVVTPDGDTTSVTLSLELEDDSGNRVAASTRVALRNRTFEF